MGDETLQDRRTRNQQLDSQRRIANALDRIATAMEAQAEPKVIEETPEAVLNATENHMFGRYVEALNKAGFRVVRK